MKSQSKGSPTLQEALNALRSTDMLLDRLLDRGEPVTRKMYLLAAYCGEQPTPLPAELEAHLPEPLRIWSPHQVKASSSPDAEPLNAMERMVLRLDAALRASGRTVTVMEPSDTNEFRATIPQGRRPRSKQQPE